MVVENLKKYVVADYNELWKLYKKGKLGKIEQRISDDLKKMVVGVDGTDEELIIALLCTDTDNVYQVSRCKRGFKITIIEFSISIDFTEKTKKIDINRMLAYSAIKIRANPTAPYSILNPDTNSDSPSAK